VNRDLNVETFTTPTGQHAVGIDDGENITITLCASAGEALALAAALRPGRRFDPMKPTVGDLVDVKTIGAPLSRPPTIRRIDGRFDSTQATVGDLVGQPLSASLPPKVIATQAATNSPPLPRRIDGKLDLSQPTVGDLSTRRSSLGLTTSVESGDIALHPRRIRMCSR
jgi:hypothetical protein